jgi:hypothetical protein
MAWWMPVQGTWEIVATQGKMELFRAKAEVGKDNTITLSLPVVAIMPVTVRISSIRGSS